MAMHHRFIILISFGIFIASIFAGFLLVATSVFAILMNIPLCKSGVLMVQRQDSSSQPIEIAIDSKGYLYVTQSYCCHFTGCTEVYQEWDLCYFMGLPWIWARKDAPIPAGITVDSSDQVYVTDNGNPDNGIQKFTDNGTYITGWGTVELRPGVVRHSIRNRRGLVLEMSM